MTATWTSAQLATYLGQSQPAGMRWAQRFGITARKGGTQPGGRRGSVGFRFTLGQMIVARALCEDATHAGQSTTSAPARRRLERLLCTDGVALIDVEWPPRYLVVHRGVVAATDQPEVIVNAVNAPGGHTIRVVDVSAAVRLLPG